MGKFLPGHKKVGGRKPGSPRRSIASQFRELSMQVYGTVGGDKAYAEWAKKHPTQFYTFLAKTIPMEASLSVAASITLDPLDSMEIARRISYVLAQIAAATPRAIELNPAQNTADTEDAIVIETGDTGASPEPHETILARSGDDFSGKDGEC